MYEHLTDCSLEVKTETGQSVQLFGCKNVNLQIHGKVNMIQVMNCQSTAVILETSISQIDLINCKNINVQVSGTAPTFNIENTQEVKLFLSNETLEKSDVMLFRSDLVQIIQFEDEDEKDFAIPTHFVSKIRNGKLETHVVEVDGE